MKYNDFPLNDVAEAALELTKRGATVHQKYTCTKCGSRQTMGEANKFFMQGKCQECSHITDIRSSGCNYLVIWGEVNYGDLQ